MSVVATAAGTGAFGLAIGFATGLSGTKGTTKKALTVLGGVAATGGLVGWYQQRGTRGVALGCLSVGFIVGLASGALLRQSRGLRVMAPRNSE